MRKMMLISAAAIVSLGLAACGEAPAEKEAGEAAETVEVDEPEAGADSEDQGSTDQGSTDQGSTDQ